MHIPTQLIRAAALAVAVISFASGKVACGAERPTLLNTCDPRPDILPRPIYDNVTEYRAQYNRPRYCTGWIASKIAPSSQEAMVWQENYCAGRYAKPCMPPLCKTFYYPKPWEALQTAARPNSPAPMAENY